MKAPVAQIIQSIPDVTSRLALTELFNAIADQFSCRSLNSAGLVIKTGGSAIVKTGASDWYGLVKGKLVKKAAATDMPALVGTVVNATFNVYVFDVDAAGTVTSSMGTPGATLVAVRFPELKKEQTRIGFIIVNPTGTGNFVGGTTALDDATVAPNVVYINNVGAFDHTFVR